MNLRLDVIIELVDIFTIQSGRYTITFKNKISRYYECKNSAIIYTSENDTLYGVGFTKNKEGARIFSILWEFNKRPILGFMIDGYRGKEVVRVSTQAPFHDILYLLDSNTGEIILETPTRQ